MLILERKLDQVIMIGPDIQIKVVDIRSLTRVRIGIQAPPEYHIDRLEVFLRKQTEGFSEEKTYLNDAKKERTGQ